MIRKNMIIHKQQCATIGNQRNNTMILDLPWATIDIGGSLENQDHLPSIVWTLNQYPLMTVARFKSKYQLSWSDNHQRLARFKSTYHGRTTAKNCVYFDKWCSIVSVSGFVVSWSEIVNAASSPIDIFFLAFFFHSISILAGYFSYRANHFLIELCQVLILYLQLSKEWTWGQLWHNFV